MPDAVNQVYNVAVGDRTTLNELFEAIRVLLAPRFPHLAGFTPSYRDFRAGDVRHSLADITKARTLLGYEPEPSDSGRFARGDGLVRRQCRRAVGPVPAGTTRPGRVCGGWR